MSTAVVAPAVFSGKPKKLLEQMRDVLRVKHYSLRTERSYCDWVKRFVRFHNLRHPREMGAAKIVAFLTHLARDSGVAASTQNQHVKASLTCQEQVEGRRVLRLRTQVGERRRFLYRLLGQSAKANPGA